MIVHEKLTIRPYHLEDMQALADLTNAANRAVGDDRRLDVDELRLNFESPLFDPARDSFILERDGKLIGFTDFEFNPAKGIAWVNAAVYPDHWHEGIGTQLIRLAEARVVERVEAELPPDQPVAIQRHTNAVNQVAARLFESEGYRLLRTFYRMRMELDQPIEAPLPEGIALRPFEPSDAHAVYEAFQEAFADHWGFDPTSFEEFERYILHRPTNDVTLWLLACDGDEIAGFCLNRRFGDEDLQMGWVWELGVRRPWRKRGIGSALLRHSLALFQQRGFRRAGLGVDASSPTNAVALYERAGMQVQHRLLVYRKTLRGTLED